MLVTQTHQGLSNCYKFDERNKQLFITHEGAICISTSCIREFAQHAAMLSSAALSEFHIYGDDLSGCYNHTTMPTINAALRILISCLPDTITCVDVSTIPGHCFADFGDDLCALVRRCKHLRMLRHQLYINDYLRFSQALRVWGTVIDLAICLFDDGPSESIALMLYQCRDIFEHIVVFIVDTIMSNRIVDMLSGIHIHKISFARLRLVNVNSVLKIVNANKHITSVDVATILSTWGHHDNNDYKSLFDLATVGHITDVNFNNNIMTIDIAEKIFAKTKAKKLQFTTPISRYGDNYYEVEQRCIHALESNLSLIKLSTNACTTRGLDAASKKITARNIMIMPKNVHSVLVDICIALLPHFDNIYCIMWIFDHISEHYYRHVSGAFKIGVIMNVKKSIDTIKQSHM